ncbi:MAG: molybdenum cofactor biosynthesis protein MoaE [Acidobacteria bacterium]|nr:molybdenum cofactor biosynthesis protein MoaE [Acidobacteriota bacterium]
MILTDLTHQPLDPAAVARHLTADDCGGQVWFHGVVRDHSRGKRVRCLEYSAYEEMARRQLSSLAEEVARDSDVRRIAVIHRLGRLDVGETAVIIGVAAAHRREAFSACRRLIDALKERVPIWKKEYYDDGESWIEEGGAPAPGSGGGYGQ